MSAISSCIVLNWTTEEQLQTIAMVLEESLNRLNESMKTEGRECDPKPEQEVLWNGLHNMLCDLKVPGYEMS